MYLILSLLFAVGLIADGNFNSSHICKSCHPLIYKEYFDSMHRRSSIFNDPVHKAVWDLHPLKKRGRYSCAKCHTPSDTKLMEALKSGKTALPKENDIQLQEPIGCTYCHRIENIKKGSKSNINIISDKERYYFAAKNGKNEESVIKYHKSSDMMGFGKKGIGSPFHTIDYSNPNFSNGKICIGCHEFKKNSKGLDVCAMDLERSKKGNNNCITCHMPQVNGPISTLTSEKSHAFHGFAGLHNNPKMLAKYIKLKIVPADETIAVSIKNEADHRLFAHPLRVAQLRVTVIRDGKSFTLPAVSFYRILGKESRPAMPWEATEVLKEYSLEAHDTKRLEFNFKTESGDLIEATLGYYIVNPKAAKKLGLQDSKESSFKTLVTQKMQIK